MTRTHHAGRACVIAYRLVLKPGITGSDGGTATPWKRWIEVHYKMHSGKLEVEIHCSGSAGASVVAHSVALPLIEIAFSTLDCSIVPTCGAWCFGTAAKRGPLKQSWAEIQHSRDDEPLGILMQMRNVRVNGFFFLSSLGVLPSVLVDTLSLCSGNFCVECVLIVLHKFYIELY